MDILSRLPNSWRAMRVEKGFISRTTILRTIVIAALLGICASLLWVPLSLVAGHSRGTFSQSSQVTTTAPTEDALRHYVGSEGCGISQRDLYYVPPPVTPNHSPFCKNRVTLLESMSGGGRAHVDEPYVGKGCTYKWFSAAEICMILERFNTVVFVGDKVAQAIYTALNILLNEDLALGGLQYRMSSKKERAACICENQFSNAECLTHAITSSEELKIKSTKRKAADVYCRRVKHVYIHVSTTPASTIATSLFKSLMYGMPNSWQPSPVIFSFGHSSSFDATVTSRALIEWLNIAIGAERNVPMLLLGPQAFGLNRSLATSASDVNLARQHFYNEIAGIASENYYEVLSLFNLTLRASSIDGESFGESVALVEAMMIINWLSMLATS